MLIFIVHFTTICLAYIVTLHLFLQTTTSPPPPPKKDADTLQTYAHKHARMHISVHMHAHTHPTQAHSSNSPPPPPQKKKKPHESTCTPQTQIASTNKCNQRKKHRNILLLHSCLSLKDTKIDDDRLIRLFGSTLNQSRKQMQLFFTKTGNSTVKQYTEGQAEFMTNVNNLHVMDVNSMTYCKWNEQDLLPTSLEGCLWYKRGALFSHS